MKIYGYNIVTTLPPTPRVGQEVFLSPDGLTGTLQYYNGTAWVAMPLPVPVYANDGTTVLFRAFPA